MKTFEKKQQGLALIMAILLVGLAVALVASISITGNYENSLSRQVFTQAKLENYVLSAETVGISVLKADNLAYDACTEEWAAMRVFPADESFENATFTVSIEDAQANYNINRLVQDVNGKWEVIPEQVTAFENYLNAQLKIPDAKITTPVNEIAASLADWIDSDDVPLNNGRESFDYEGFKVANNPILSIEEIFAHPFFESHEHRFGWMSSTVSVELTALPPATPINVNTAKPDVLAALMFTGQLINKDTLSDIDALRSKEPIADIKVVASVNAFKEASDSEISDFLNQITVQSSYFYIYSKVELEEESMILRTLVNRDQNGTITVLERRFANPWPQQPFLNPSPC